jgi:PEP-CTERM motif
VIDPARYRISPWCVFSLVVICSLLAFGFTPSARADTTYTYTGQPFTNFSGADSCTNGVGECFLSGTITFASPFPSNSVFSIFGDFDEPVALPPNLLSFSISDGVQSFSIASHHSNGAEFGIYLDTGPNGQIENWVFFIAGNPEAGLGTAGPGLVLGPTGLIGPTDLTTSDNGGVSSNFGTPGTWTTSTPEPNSLLIFGTGFLGLLGIRKYRSWK